MITSGGTRIITDPFNEKLGYPMFPRQAEIVTISHQHWDHNAGECIGGAPRVIEGPGRQIIGDIVISGISAWHDTKQGQERGVNTIFSICAEELHVVHLGDLGHVLEHKQIEEIGRTDILLLPVGGKFTVDAERASEIVEQLQPKLVIPMHYQVSNQFPLLSVALAPLENFICRYEKILKLPALEIEATELPAEGPGIIVLDYLLG